MKLQRPSPLYTARLCPFVKRGKLYLSVVAGLPLAFCAPFLPINQTFLPTQTPPVSLKSPNIPHVRGPGGRFLTANAQAAAVVVYLDAGPADKRVYPTGIMITHEL